jgi:GNAT superfamily N-acetyltransferase
MYWRIGSDYHKRPREENRAAIRRIVMRGPPPGLLAFEGARPIGWCQLTPREDLPWLERARLLQRVDAAPVWCISCFYVRRGFRRQGVMTALIAAALQAARRAKAPALEAYPIDATAPKSTSNLFTGIASVFRRSGFKIIARLSPYRPIMRHELGAARRFSQEHA